MAGSDAVILTGLVVAALTGTGGVVTLLLEPVRPTRILGLGMTPSESTFWRVGLVPGFSGDRLGRCVEELVDGEQFAAGAG